MFSFGGVCHIAARNSGIKSSQDWLLCGLVKADRLPISCAKSRTRDCEMTWPTLPNSSSRQLMRSPLSSRGLCQVLESTCLECEEARERDEVRPKILISLQTCAGWENVQTHTSQTCFNPRHEPLCCWWGGLGAFASSPDTHWVQQSSMLRYRQGVRSSALDCQLSDKWGKADTMRGRLAQCAQRWQEPKIEEERGNGKEK